MSDKVEKTKVLKATLRQLSNKFRNQQSRLIVAGKEHLRALDSARLYGVVEDAQNI